MGKKHTWRIIAGAFIFFTPLLLYRLIRLVVETGDALWNDIFFQPFGVHGAPVLGTIFLFLLLYGLGWIRETRGGAWVFEHTLSRIPVAGKFFDAPTNSSREVFRKIDGFVFAPVWWRGYRPARFSAIFPLEGGHWWAILAVLFVPFPVPVSYPDTTIIWALCPPHPAAAYGTIPQEYARAIGDRRYSVFSTEVGLRIEFSAGATIPANTFFHLKPVTMREFIASYNF